MSLQQEEGGDGNHRVACAGNVAHAAMEGRLVVELVVLPVVERDALGRHGHHHLVNALPLGKLLRKVVDLLQRQLGVLLHMQTL